MEHSWYWYCWWGDFQARSSSCLCRRSSVLTLGEVGEVRGILSATTVNSLVNSWAMTGTDSDFAAAWIIRRHARAHLYDYDFEVDKSVHDMTSQDGSIWKQSVWRCAEGEKERTANARKLSFTPPTPRLRGSSGDVLLEQHICRPTHYSRIHSGLTHAQDRIQISPTKLLGLSLSSVQL